jgi:hypothetical protein
VQRTPQSAVRRVVEQINSVKTQRLAVVVYAQVVNMLVSLEALNVVQMEPSVAGMVCAVHPIHVASAEPVDRSLIPHVHRGDAQQQRRLGFGSIATQQTPKPNRDRECDSLQMNHGERP